MFKKVGLVMKVTREMSDLIVDLIIKSNYKYDNLIVLTKSNKKDTLILVERATRDSIIILNREAMYDFIKAVKEAKANSKITEFKNDYAYPYLNKVVKDYLDKHINDRVKILEVVVKRIEENIKEVERNLKSTYVEDWIVYIKGNKEEIEEELNKLGLTYKSTKGYFLVGIVNRDYNNVMRSKDFRELYKREFKYRNVPNVLTYLKRDNRLDLGLDLEMNIKSIGLLKSKIEELQTIDQQINELLNLPYEKAHFLAVKFNRLKEED